MWAISLRGSFDERAGNSLGIDTHTSYTDIHKMQERITIPTNRSYANRKFRDCIKKLEPYLQDTDYTHQDLFQFLQQTKLHRPLTYEIMGQFFDWMETR